MTEEKRQENFHALVDRAMRVQGRTLMRPVVEKELIHYDVLFALDKHNLLDQLTFQDGTALRLCYGAERFSEDLDFVGGKDFNASNLMEIKNCIETYIGNRYGLSVDVKSPKEVALMPENKEIKVCKWQIRITTRPERPDIKKQMIKIEVANLPAYSREPLALIRNYNFLPDGYSDTIVLTESLNEIMADKLIAFVNMTKKIRYRDIWDLRWIKKRGGEINPQYIKDKIEDYQINDYQDKLTQMLSELKKHIFSDTFYKEMTRFLPEDVLEDTLNKEKYKQFLYNEIKNILNEVNSICSGK